MIFREFLLGVNDIGATEVTDIKDIILVLFYDMLFLYHNNKYINLYKCVSVVAQCENLITPIINATTLTMDSRSSSKDNKSDVNTEIPLAA